MCLSKNLSISKESSSLWSWSWPLFRWGIRYAYGLLLYSNISPCELSPFFSAVESLEHLSGKRCAWFAEVLVEYAERAPVSKIAEAKLIQALGWMCTTNEFRLAAIMVLRKIFERKFTPVKSQFYYPFCFFIWTRRKLNFQGFSFLLAV